jgi:hypothetical protein
VPSRTPFAVGWSGRSPQGRSSKRRLRRLQRELTRREILVAVLGVIALLAFALAAAIGQRRHREEHHQRRRKPHAR